MRTRGMLAVVVLGFAFCATAYAAKGILLRYKYKAGASQKYAMRATMTTRMSGVKQAAPGANTMTMKGSLTVKTTAVSAAGVAAQEVKITDMEMVAPGMKMTLKNGKMSGTMGGKPMKMSKEEQDQAVDMSLKQKVDTRGQVVGSAESAGSPLSGMGPFGSNQITAVFPKNAVSPGHKWSQTIKTALGAGGAAPAMSVDMTYRFAGLEKYKGADVARITFQGKGKMGPTPKGGRAGMGDVNQTLSGYQLFDYKAGVARYIKVKSQDVAKPRAAAGKAPSGSMTMTSDMEIILQ